MPTISTFYGITIRMYYDDHAPPHFHAYYGSDAVLVDIRTQGVLDGHIPRRALALTLEWAALRQLELMNNWDRAERHEPLKPIDPLD